MRKILLAAIVLTHFFAFQLIAQHDQVLYPSLTDIGQYATGPANQDIDNFYALKQIEMKPDVGSPAEVLVVVNENSETSMKIGEYYMQLRGIPDVNLCILNCSTSEEIQRNEYTGNIALPIMDYIEDNGLKSRIKYIVTTKGVPLKVYGDGLFTLKTYAASVDSELVLYDYGFYGYNSWYENPYYRQNSNLDRNNIPIYLVNRLTAYDIDNDMDGIPDAIKSYLDKALFPPDYEGKFVIDYAPEMNYGGYDSGNNWLLEAASILTDMGAEVKLDETTDFLVNETDVIGYASWGSNDPRSKNHGEPYFDWIDGSIATTYVSTNARTFAYPPSYGQSMIADMIEEGVTGVYGNVYEPFLPACAKPNILFPRYYSGYNLAESYYMSLEFVSWMEIVVGDPLCAPFAEPMPRVYVTTNKVIYKSGDSFSVDVDIWNTGEDINTRLYLAIYINNSFHFYPNWNTKVAYIDQRLRDKSRSHMDIIDINLSRDLLKGDYAFYSMVTDSQGYLIGKLSSAEFQFE